MVTAPVAAFAGGEPVVDIGKTVADRTDLAVGIQAEEFRPATIYSSLVEQRDAEPGEVGDLFRCEKLFGVRQRTQRRYAARADR